MTRQRTSHGFTMLEICVVMAIAVLIMGIGVPSLRGQMLRQRLQRAFDQLDALAAQTRELAMKNGKPYLLAWDKDGNVNLYPAELNNAARRKQGPVASLRSSKENGTYRLRRPSALSPQQPSAEWTFWPSGTCEPVVVDYKSQSGEWEANYNALSGRGDLVRFIAE